MQPDAVFTMTLGDLLAGGKAHLAAVPGARPSDAEAWGWARTEAPEGLLQPRGELLGWVDEHSVYLIPTLAHRLVAKTVGERGDNFIVSERALTKALERGGFLQPGNKGHRHNLRVGGAVRNTIRLNRQAVEAAWGGARD